MKYGMGSLLITSIVQKDIPLFSKIEWIVNIRNKWYIGGKDAIPKTFDEKTWSYECSVTEHISFQELSTNSFLSACLCTGMAQSTTTIVKKVWSKDIDPPIRKYINAENFEQFKEKGKS